MSVRVRVPRPPPPPAGRRGGGLAAPREAGAGRAPGGPAGGPVGAGQTRLAPFAPYLVPRGPWGQRWLFFFLFFSFFAGVAEGRARGERLWLSVVTGSWKVKAQRVGAHPGPDFDLPGGTRSSAFLPLPTLRTHPASTFSVFSTPFQPALSPRYFPVSTQLPRGFLLGKTSWKHLLGAEG